MMRAMWMAAACALAACGAADGAADRRDAPATADAVAETAAAADAVSGDTAYAFRLHEAEPGTVDSITVTRGGRAVQTLRPSENHVPPEHGIGRISRIDLDFDGHGDLGLIADVGMVNSASEYWRLDPAAGRFVPAGVHPTLTPDSAAREHATFNRGGHAGRLWTASRYRWMDGALAEVRREAQELAEGGDGYVRVVRERRGNALVETSRRPLEDAELDAGPSWTAP